MIESFETLILPKIWLILLSLLGLCLVGAYIVHQTSASYLGLKSIEKFKEFVKVFLYLFVASSFLIALDIFVILKLNCEC